MTNGAAFDQNDFVTIFDDTYNQPDCRHYFRMMDDLGYRNQQHAASAFRAAVTELERVRGLQRETRVIDFACSYGIVTALMRHDISLADVFERYREPRFDTASAQEVKDWDRDWLAQNLRHGHGAHYTGIDVAENAVAYAVDVGLIDAGFVEDLNAVAPSPALNTAISKSDIVVECGSVAHLMPNILDRVLSLSTGPKPWIITSPVRGNERNEALAVMRDHGLVVEKMPIPPFIHRRFSDADEQARAIENARACGHETDGFESTGHFHAQLYLARPAEEATPVSDWCASV